MDININRLCSELSGLAKNDDSVYQLSTDNSGKVVKQEKNLTEEQKRLNKDFRTGLFNSLSAVTVDKEAIDNLRKELGISDQNQEIPDEPLAARKIYDVIQATMDRFEERIDDVLSRKFEPPVKSLIRKAVQENPQHAVVRAFLGKDGATVDNLARLCRLAAQSNVNAVDKCALAYLRGFSYKTEQLSNVQVIGAIENSEVEGRRHVDEEYEHEANRNQVTQYRQSPKANTCFAMSVLNACSKSKELSEYLSQKGLKNGLNTEKLELISSKDCVEIDDKKYSHNVELTSLEKAIVKWALQNDKDYRKAFPNKEPLPYGSGAEFGKALGLVQSCPDVRIQRKDEKIVEKQDATQEQTQIKKAAAIREQIKAHLDNGGIVIMNINQGHFVAVTDIKDDELTIVDSAQEKSYVKNLEYYEKDPDSHTFSFLELPAREKTGAVKAKVTDLLQDNSIKNTLGEKLNLQGKKSTVADALGVLKIKITLDEPDFDEHNALEVVQTAKNQKRGEILELKGVSQDQLDKKKDLTSEKVEEVKKALNEADEPYDNLYTAIVQWQKAKRLAEIVHSETLNEKVTGYLKSLDETIEGCQKKFDWGDINLEDDILDLAKNKVYDDFLDWLDGNSKVQH